MKIFYCKTYFLGDADSFYGELDWDVAITDVSFRLDGSTLYIGNSPYKAIIDHTAAESLYLTALNADFYGIEGVYELGSGDQYSGDNEYEACVSTDRIRAAEAAGR